MNFISTTNADVSKRENQTFEEMASKHNNFEAKLLNQFSLHLTQRNTPRNLTTFHKSVQIPDPNPEQRNASKWSWESSLLATHYSYQCQANWSILFLNSYKTNCVFLSHLDKYLDTNKLELLSLIMRTTSASLSDSPGRSFICKDSVLPNSTSVCVFPSASKIDLVAMRCGIWWNAGFHNVDQLYSHTRLFRMVISTRATNWLLGKKPKDGESLTQKERHTCWTYGIISRHFFAKPPIIGVYSGPRVD